MKRAIHPKRRLAMKAKAEAPRVLAVMAKEAGDRRSIEELESFYRIKQHDSPMVQAFQQALAEEAACAVAKVA